MDDSQKRGFGAMEERANREISRDDDSSRGDAGRAGGSDQGKA
jgi:hypothetical protein